MNIELRKQYVEFLHRYKWEWWMGISLPVDKKSIVDRRRLSWIRSVCKGEHIQMGCMYLIKHDPGYVHLHMLCLGHNAQGKSLLDVDESKWKAGVTYLSKVTDRRASIIYIIDHMQYKDVEIDVYNVDLLQKLGNKL
jgi:hypothetical protein